MIGSISRRRWYHTEIPIWYSEDENHIIVPPAGIYVQPWKDSPPKGSRVLRRDTREDIGAYSELESELGTIRGEEKIFDTWMDSSARTFSSSWALQPTRSIRKIRSQPHCDHRGKKLFEPGCTMPYLNQHFLLDKPGFEHVWIDGLGMDPWGRKMSKSLGNGIDADSVLECGAGGRTGSWKVRGPDSSVHLANKIGSECFRYGRPAKHKVGDDFHINPEEIESKYFGVLTKLFNVARFASQFDCPEHEPSNFGILSKMNGFNQNLLLDEHG